MSSSDAVRDTYLTGLRNQHEVESQAIETLERQLGRYDSYPDLHARMQQDLERSRTQMSRLESLLSQHGTSASGVKETVGSIIGKVAGVAHVSADDQVVKDVLAAYGYKNYEIGSYKMLVALANEAGDGTGAGVLQQSLAEEQEMSQFLDSILANVALTYARRTAS